MLARLKGLCGPLALALVVGGGLFVAGARYGSARTLETIAARLRQASAARAAKPQAPMLAPAPASPDPRTIASPAAPAPKAGTVRRYAGDALVSEESTDALNAVRPGQ